METDKLLNSKSSSSELPESNSKSTDSTDTPEIPQKSPSSTSYSILILLVCASIAATYFAYTKLVKNVDDKDSPDGATKSTLTKISEDIIDWIEAQGEMGPVYYVIFLAIWVILLLPCSVLEIVPGFLFGFKTGWIVSILGKSLGSLISLLIGRYLLKETINNYVVERYPTIKAFNKAVELEGFKVIMMIRVTYLPMLVKNYGLSVLDVPIWQVTLASLLAGVPFSAAWAAIGASSKNLSEIMKGNMKISDAFPQENRELYFAAIVIGAGMFLYVFTRLGRRFRQILKEINGKDH